MRHASQSPISAEALAKADVAPIVVEEASSSLPWLLWLGIRRHSPANESADTADAAAPGATTAASARGTGDCDWRHGSADDVRWRVSSAVERRSGRSATEVRAAELSRWTVDWASSYSLRKW